VLDVRRGKLHRMSARLPKGFDALLNAEVSAFLSLFEVNRPGMSGDSTCWEGWSHVRWFVEEVSAGVA
jgi:hypothetical protein